MNLNMCMYIYESNGKKLIDQVSFLYYCSIIPNNFFPFF